MWSDWAFCASAYVQGLLLPQIDPVFTLEVCEGVCVRLQKPKWTKYALVVLQTVLHFYFSAT